jgi:hypothetical protein
MKRIISSVDPLNESGACGQENLPDFTAVAIPQLRLSFVPAESFQIKNFLAFAFNI